jgi:SAM-dependent methyltransferase
MSVASAAREWVRGVEDWWFDSTRGVKTTGLMRVPAPSQVVGEIRDSNMYGAVRAANAHAALRDLPIRDYSEYTFIDMGSGLGRVLFVAAEYPFRRVVGVEFATGLHRQALDNIARYRHGKSRCGSIESVLANAAEYEFPDEKLVIFMFNPFGPEILSRMLANLDRSLRRCPRHVVVLMLWPEHSAVVAGMASMREYRRTRRYHIYQTEG